MSGTWDDADHAEMRSSRLTLKLTDLFLIRRGLDTRPAQYAHLMTARDAAGRMQQHWIMLR